MDRRITIQTAEEIDDPFGGTVTDWVDWLTIWAEVVQEGGREFFADQRIEAEAKALFRTRWIEGPDETMQILYEGRVYGINAIREIGRRDGLEFQTTWTA